ncbi:MAG TPA: aminoglycoside phosphotransferase [Streptosporangiaceae bacterium]|nr:aminoglycoside phosphotransferase [Streptosporangiaceae bacterium]
MSNGALAELLSSWLPAQRWFAGSGAIVREITITSDVQLSAGDPESRHLIIAATVGAETVSYQVLVGLATDLRPELGPAVIGTLPDGRIAYDGAVDPGLTSLLLTWIAEQRRAGRLRFVAEAGAVIDTTSPGRTLPALHSNTGVVFGDKAILKLLRRPFTGHHPDVEIPATLARAGSRLVAAPLGWIELDELDGAGGEPATLAILSEFFPNSTDAWSIATASVHDGASSFTGQARLLGEATAELHDELAEAFGTAALPRPALADLRRDLVAEFTAAREVVPALAGYERAIADCYARVTELTGQVTIQRIHGDYHLAQVIGTGDGWVVLDFEGEPSVPLARRRAYAPALRDVAGMLRSFDYAGRHQSLADPGDQLLKAVASDWVDRCQDAFCAGYGAASGSDPRQHGALLRALTLQKAVYEAVYEARHRPGWLPIPLHAIAEAADGGGR